MGLLLRRLALRSNPRPAQRLLPIGPLLVAMMLVQLKPSDLIPALASTKGIRGAPLQAAPRIQIST